MSSKRKSPPSKLQEGAPKPELDSATAPDSDHEELPSTPNFYKYSPTNSNVSDQSDEDLGSLDEERPVKKLKFSQGLEMTNNLLVPAAFLGLHSLGDLQGRRRGSSECSSPGADSKILGLCNNNNSLLNHNSALSLAQPHKRTMDDVLKRLTSKMNNSTIKEEKRPTPSTTPVKQNDRRSSGLDAAAIHALAGETILEKERRLSDMILQLQMVREQLLAQQEHAKFVAARSVVALEDYQYVISEIIKNIGTGVDDKLADPMANEVDSTDVKIGNAVAQNPKNIAQCLMKLVEEEMKTMLGLKPLLEEELGPVIAIEKKVEAALNLLASGDVNGGKAKLNEAVDNIKKLPEHFKSFGPRVKKAMEDHLNEVKQKGQECTKLKNN